MVTEGTLEGALPWLCGGQFHLGSSCTQRSIVDILNLLFLLSFCLALLVKSFRKQYTRDCVFVVVSVCCTLTSFAYFGASFWTLLHTGGEALHWSWVVYFVRGLIWIALAASLHVHLTKWMKVLVSLWWVSFSVLVSALNVETLARTHTFQILDMVSWPVNLLLLFCALGIAGNVFPHDAGDDDDEGGGGLLSRPLLAEVGHRKSELGRAGFLSLVTFSWINPLLRSGYQKPLNLDTVPALDWEDGALRACESFLHSWNTIQGKKYSVTSNLVVLTLAKCYTKEMILVGIYAFLRTIAVVSLPVLLYAFVQYSNSEKGDAFLGVFLVGCLLVVKLVESLSQRHWFFDARRFGMRMRSALMAAIFRKQLKLSNSGRRKHSRGEIVNYIAVDAYRLGEFPWWFHMAWSLPLQLFLGIAVLFGIVGLGVLPGLVPLILFGILNLPFAKILQKCQSRVVAAQDDRLRATSEILNSMKIIKLQAWEEKFQSVIQSLRDIEFKWLAESQIKKAYGSALYWMSPTFVSSVVFAGCAALGTAPLNASTIFTVLATLRVMAEPAKMLPEVLSVMIQTKVSLDRLDAFLQEDELDEEDVKRSHLGNSDVCVRISAGDFSWDPDAAPVTLRCVDLEMSRGQKIAVCGPVGAGKSSLLAAILGEIPKISGTVEVFGSIAYVSQTSWIQSGTIRDIILFGRPMNKARYELVIRACALDKDIDNFDYGDLTEIGQRGINLSGGQKQRVQLARAVYSNADTYLLDDPFSAVDAHTASILFNDCVMSALRKKTVILVTHQVEFLTETDRILVIEDGKITQSGTYEELLKSGTAFDQLVNAHQSALAVLDSVDRKYKCEDPETVMTQQVGNGMQPQKENSKADSATKGLAKTQLTAEEEKEMGNLGWKPYVDYISVSRAFLLLGLVILCQSGFVILQAISTFWLAIAIQIPHISNGTLIGVYAVFSVLSGVSAYMRSWLGAHLGLKASKAFFSGFMDSLFKAPMQFFDSTPVGRILTRASTDLSVLDFNIPYSLAFALVAAIEVLATILIMSVVTWPVVIAAIPIMFFARYLQRYYLASARELIRINGTTKAPVVNYAAETSLGVITIRAFGMVERFIRNNLKLIDNDATLFFHTIASMEWLLMRVEALQNLTIVTAILTMVLLPRGTIAPGFVGLSLSYALTLTTSQVFLTRWYCNLDNHIISIERIKQYMNIPSEPSAIIDESRPPSSWPSEGQIDFRDLRVKYRPDAPLILKGITCTFKAGNKVGVVGRTGSGKSTLISALFRLVEPVGGRILIDKLDICSMGLRDLRMKLSIIPQETALFRGSVRSNLDPLGLFSDQQIWEAIEKCQLKTMVSNLPNLLDSSVSDEGENLSAGQRQLFCLGRILLQRNKILVLDEATASIDSATDAILQRVIKEEFSSCTVITIAHRVPTVTDSDMVMVLSNGEVVEYDKPSRLMESNSAFSRLVAEYCGPSVKESPST
uniref:ABC transporter C family member 8 n=1 Tax=Anthurium amnicola TaxID=1678845 RepID=A0A1D1ZGM2_9ARAE